MCLFIYKEYTELNIIINLIGFWINDKLSLTDVKDGTLLFDINWIKKVKTEEKKKKSKKICVYLQYVLPKLLYNWFYGKEILVLFQEGELNKKKHLKTLHSDTFRDSIETICHGVTEHCTGCLIISQYGWGFARRYPCFKLHVLSCHFEHTKTLHRYSCQFAERCTTENHVIATERYVWVMFLNLFLITS